MARIIINEAQCKITTPGWDRLTIIQIQWTKYTFRVIIWLDHQKVETQAERFKARIKLWRQDCHQVILHHTNRLLIMFFTKSTITIYPHSHIQILLGVTVVLDHQVRLYFYPFYYLDYLLFFWSGMIYLHLLHCRHYRFISSSTVCILFNNRARS